MFPHRTPTTRRIYQMRERKQPNGNVSWIYGRFEAFGRLLCPHLLGVVESTKFFGNIFFVSCKFLDFFLIHKKIVKDIIIIDRVESLRRFCLYWNLFVSFSSRAVSFRFSLDRRVGGNEKKDDERALILWHSIRCYSQARYDRLSISCRRAVSHVFDLIRWKKERANFSDATRHTSMSSLATWWSRRLIKLMDLYMSCHLRLPFTLNAAQLS